MNNRDNRIGAAQSRKPIRAIWFALLLSLTGSVHAQVLSWNFNETGTAATNTGTLGASYHLNLRSSADVLTDLHSADGLGVSGLAGDRALDLTAAAAMNGAGPYGQPAAENNADLILGTMTVTGWYKVEGGTTIPSGTSLFRNNTTSPRSGWFLRWTSNDRLIFGVGDGTSDVTRSSANTIFGNHGGDWLFFAVSWDGSNAAFYNGAVSNASTAAGSGALSASMATDSQALFIGRANSTGGAFDGLLDDLRVYSTALDASAIEAIRLSALTNSSAHPPTNPPAGGLVQIEPVTQHPCLLMDPQDASRIAAWRVTYPHPLDEGLNALIYGDAAAKQTATANWVAAMEATYQSITNGTQSLPSRRWREHAYFYDIIDGLGYLSEADRLRFRGYLEAYLQTTIGTSTNSLRAFGPSNLETDHINAAGLTAMLFPELPEAQMWMDWAVGATAYQLSNSIVDGVWIECPRYHEAAASWYVPFVAALQRRTDADFTQHPNLKALFEWFVRFSTMPLPLTTSLPTIPAWGDSTYGNLYQVLGAAAPFYKDTDPEFSKRLMWMWRRGGMPYATGWDFATTRPQLLDPTLPDAPQTLRSEASPGKMGQVVMRSGSGDTNEILMFFKCGESSFAHQNPDQSHFDIFAYGVPLALDSCMDNYNGTVYPNDYYDDARGHNLIVFASSLADQWRNAHFSAFASTPLADYTVGDASSPNNPVNNSYNYRCRRHIVFVKAGYFVIWDEIDSSQTPQWQLHTPAQSLLWSDRQVSCVTPWGVNLDVHALLPTNNLVPNETDQKFYRRGFFTWDTQKYFTINGTAGGDFVNVLQPRRTNAPALTATLLSADTNGVSVQVQLDGRTDLISLTVTGAVVTLGGNAPLHFGIKGTPALVSGPGDLRKIGSSPEMVGEPRSYTGDTIVEDGTLRLAPTRPLPAAGPVFWFDADNAATFEFDESGNVSRWHSAVFDFGPAKQTNHGQRPVRVPAALNNRAIVDFGAFSGNITSGDYLVFPTVRDVRSVFLVVKAGTQGILLGAERTEHFRRGSAGQIWHSSTSSSNVRNGVTRLNGAVVNGTTTTLPANNYSLVSLAAAGPTMADALGRWATFGSGGIQLAEVIAYNRPLYSQEVTNVEAYLNHKWFGLGNTTNLPPLPSANLLPATTDLLLATAGAALELNGINQSVASLAAVPGSAVMVNGGSLTLTGVPAGAFGGEIAGAGSVTNKGTLRLAESARFDLTGAFINEGVLDVLDWSAPLPPGFVNAGTILDQNAVAVTNAARSGNEFVVSTFGWAGRTFQLQSAAALSGPWQDVGASQPGNNQPLQLIHFDGVTKSAGFYRIRVW